MDVFMCICAFHVCIYYYELVFSTLFFSCSRSKLNRLLCTQLFSFFGVCDAFTSLLLLLFLLFIDVVAVADSLTAATIHFFPSNTRTSSVHLYYFFSSLSCAPLNFQIGMCILPSISFQIKKERVHNKKNKY